VRALCLVPPKSSLRAITNRRPSLRGEYRRELVVLMTTAELGLCIAPDIDAPA